MSSVTMPARSTENSVAGFDWSRALRSCTGHLGEPYSNSFTVAAEWNSNQMRASRALGTALLLSLICVGLFGQTALSEADRIAELKQRVIATLNLRPGSRAADVGCGDGYYTIPLARAVGVSGKVYAEDISEAELGKLKDRLATEALANVEVIKGAVDDPMLPLGTLDGVLVVNAYHEMTAHEAILRHIRDALKPGGTFVLM